MAIEFGPLTVPVSGADLDVVERALGVVLPASVRAFYLKHNGADFADAVIEVGDGRVIFHNLIPACDVGRVRGLVAARNAMVDDCQCPRADLLPFGDDPGGDWICVSLGAEDFGTVWLFIMDSTEPRCEKLAESFDGFLDRLQPYTQPCSEPS